MHTFFTTFCVFSVYIYIYDDDSLHSLIMETDSTGAKTVRNSILGSWGAAPPAFAFSF